MQLDINQGPIFALPLCRDLNRTLSFGLTVEVDRLSSNVLGNQKLVNVLADNFFFYITE